MAATIIATDDVARHLGVLTTDSLRSRITPSSGLESTAQYIAAEFNRLGLTTTILRYPLPRQVPMDYEQSGLLFGVRVQRGGKDVLIAEDEPLHRVVALPFVTTIYAAPQVGPQPFVEAPRSRDPFVIGQAIVAVAGPQTTATLRRVSSELRASAVLYIPAAGTDSTIQHQIIAELYAMSQGVIVVSPEDSIGFAAAHAARIQRPQMMLDDYLQLESGRRQPPWAVFVPARSIQGFLTLVGEDLTQLRTEPTSVVRTLSSATALLIAVEARGLGSDLVTAPNVVGILPGADSNFAKEYIVVSAHMDNNGISASRPGSPPVPDNTAGVVGLLEVAKALSQPGQRPRRPVVFLATSGGGPEFLGVNYFIAHPPMTGGMIAINLNLDLLGQTARDSLMVEGLRDVELATSPSWIAGARPELRLTVVDGGTVAQPRSDHFGFVRRLRPSLSFHTDGPSGLPTSTTLSADYVSRVARFIFYYSQTIGNAPQRPRWSAEGRRQLETMLP